MPSQTDKNRPPKKGTATRTITYTALFSALALIFSYIEAILPISAGMPGVKLGIANLVVIIALYKMDFKSALAINLIRILVAGLLFSGLFGALYSLAGGMLSLIAMYLLKKTDLFSIIGVSMAGGVVHNMGQLLVASFVVSNIRMFFYLPILMFSGIISGILIGVLAYFIDKKIPAFVFKN